MNPLPPAPSKAFVLLLRHAIGLVLLAGLVLPARGDEAPRERAGDAQRCGERAAAAVQRRYEGVRDLAADFVQTTRSVSLGSAAGPPVESRGRTVLAKPGKMRWTYESPEPSVVVSDGETLWLYDPTFGEVQKIPAGQGFLTGAAAEFLLGAGDMDRDFEVTALACTEQSAELELVPREPATYEKLTLVVDPRTGDVRETRVVDLLGNVATVAFQDLALNQDPADDVFRFVPPEGVKVIELTP